MSRVYISDANILIDFKNAGLLEELFRLPFALCCTDFVLRELRGLGRSELEGMGLLIEAMDGPAVLRLFELRTRHNNSSLADVSCYLLAQETGRPLLTGDGQLRRQARKDGITVHGALWLLDQLLAHEVIQHNLASEALDRMLKFGARLPPEECEVRLTAWRRGENS